MSASNEAKKFFILAAIPDGHYKCRKWWQFWKRGGWLWVQRSGGEKVILYTTAFNHSNRADGLASTIYVDGAGNLIAYARQAVSMHLRWISGAEDSVERQKAMAEAQWMESVLVRHLHIPTLQPPT